MLSPRACRLLALLLVIGGVHASKRRQYRLGSSLQIDENEATMVELEAKQAWGRILQGASMSMPGESSRGTLLAVGDSLCTGQLPEPKNTILVSEEAYVNTIYEYLQDKYGFDKIVKVCCPAEDSSELIDGNADEVDGSFCYGDGSGNGPSQLDAAVAAIEMGDVGLITISIGANDVLPCASQSDPAACAASKIAKAASNLQTILTALTEATSDAPPIIAMTPHNPLLAFYLSEDQNEQALVALSQEAALGLHVELSRVYDAFDVPVIFAAEIWDGFNDTLVDDVPQNVVNICKYTGMCDETSSGDYELKEEWDIHPKPKGYETMGEAHFNDLDDLL